MKGDFTRFTFASQKHYDAVLMQQGRVQTDADWNEQVMIAEHRSRTEAVDIIGPTGAPQDLSSGGKGAFQVYWGPDAQSTNRLFVNQGRYYVAGLMVESEAPLEYAKQPGVTLPPSAGAGIYMVYLDAWRRHVTSLEDPDIREVALAGADTGTRSELVWQIRALRVGEVGDDINAITGATFDFPWQPPNTASTGRLDARAGATPLENQLYRVEIHRGGTAAAASCKWSRDNGTVVARVLSATPPLAAAGVWQFSIQIDRNGRDSFSSFLPGQMVELSNDEFALQRKPGVFGSITNVVGDTLLLEVPQASAPLTASGPGAEINNPLLGTTPTVRRWDNSWNPDLSSISLVNAGSDYTTADVPARLQLESDVTIQFTAGAGQFYQTGDYWLIPARTASGLVDWVVNQPQPAAGEQHFYAPLALVRVQASGTVANPATDIRDMRKVFPTLRSLGGGGGGGIVTGTGATNVLSKWVSNTSELTTSSIVDDGALVSVGGRLKVGAGAAPASVPIGSFTSAALFSLSATDLASTVPTSAAVVSLVNRSVPSGTVVAYASQTIPPGWLECNGSSLDGATAQYAALFSAIGKAFGTGSGSATGFNLPDLRGRFVRGWNHFAGRDPDASGRTASVAGGNSGDQVGSLQGDELRAHGHPVSAAGTAANVTLFHTHPYQGESSRSWSTGIQLSGGGTSTVIQRLTFASHPTGLTDVGHSHSVSVSGSAANTGGNETRPKNVYLTYIIKL